MGKTDRGTWVWGYDFLGRKANMDEALNGRYKQNMKASPEAL